MAWTVVYDKTVMGNKAVVGMQITTDSAEATILTGLKKVDYFTMGVVSMTTIANYKIARNSGSTSTAIGGALGCSGFTSGDIVNIVVFGTR